MLERHELQAPFVIPGLLPHHHLTDERGSPARRCRTPRRRARRRPWLRSRRRLGPLAPASFSQPRQPHLRRVVRMPGVVLELLPRIQRLERQQRLVDVLPPSAATAASSANNRPRLRSPRWPGCRRSREHGARPDEDRHGHQPRFAPVRVDRADEIAAEPILEKEGIQAALLRLIRIDDGDDVDVAAVAALRERHGEPAAHRSARTPAAPLHGGPARSPSRRPGTPRAR